MKYGGWFKIAFERELERDLNTVAVGDRKLLCVKRPSGIEVYDAVCPHRGADLGVNSRLDGDAVVCGSTATTSRSARKTGGRSASADITLW